MFSVAITIITTFKIKYSTVYTYIFKDCKKKICTNERQAEKFKIRFEKSI